MTVLGNALAGLGKFARIVAGPALLAFMSPQAALAELYGATLPGSRSVVVGTDSTVFAIMLNTGTAALQNCRVALGAGAPAGLGVSYQRATVLNALTGDPADTPFSIPAGGSQNLLLAFRASQPFSGRDVTLAFVCDGAAARLAPGVNTVFLTSVGAPSADVIPIAVTPTNDGAIRVTTAGGTGFMATAAVNIGPDAFLEVRPDTGGARLNVGLTICETNPNNGQCLAPPGASVTAQFLTNQPHYFTVFATATGATPFLPDVARVRLTFRDALGAIFGMTSAALTAPGTGQPSTNPAGIYSGLVNGKPGFLVTYGLPIGNVIYGNGLFGQRETPSDGATMLSNNHLLPTDGSGNWQGVYTADGGDVPTQSVRYFGELVWDSHITGEGRRAFGVADALFDYRLVFDPITLASVPNWPAGTYDIVHNGVVIGEATATLGFEPLSGTITWPGATSSCPLQAMLTSRPGGVERNVWLINVSGGVNCARGGTAFGYAVVGDNGSVRFELLLNRISNVGGAVPGDQPDFMYFQMVRR